MLRSLGASVLAPVLALLPTCCVTFGKSLPTLGLSFFFLKMGRLDQTSDFQMIFGAPGSPRTNSRESLEVEGEAEGVVLQSPPSPSFVQSHLLLCFLCWLPTRTTGSENPKAVKPCPQRHCGD